jgi:hypothetical protein
VLVAGLTLRLNGASFLDSGGQRAGLILLLGFLLSFGFIRMSTRLIRSPRLPWWPGSVQTGSGLHIHHLVFGIVAMMLSGFLGFATEPESPWLEILAALFGIGAGLTIDEFALWLHLEDVYWAEEGRSSVDAMIVATIFGGGFVLGLAPLDTGGGGGVIAVVATTVINLGACVIAALKGKLASTLTGMFLPPVAWVSAVRLARPGSVWGKRRYRAGSSKLARAAERDTRFRARQRRLQELIGGRPSR